MVCVYLQFCWWRLLWHSHIIQIQSLRSPHSCSPTERCPFHPSLLQKVLNHFNMKAVKCLQQSLWWNGEHLKRLPPSQLFIHSFYHPFMIFHPLLVPHPLHWFSFAIYYLSSNLRFFFSSTCLSLHLLFSSSFWVLSTATRQFLLKSACYSGIHVHRRFIQAVYLCIWEV